MTTPIKEKEFYRADELARMLDISKYTVYRWMRRGNIKYFRVGNSKKISRDEFEKVLSSGLSGKDRFEAQEIDDELAKKHDTCVYLIRSEKGNYKIGLSSVLRTRMRTLYETIPMELELIGILRVKDHRRLEAELHEKYSAKRERGEWFVLSDEDVRDITIRSDFHLINLSLQEFLEIC